jgi:hypothetical protein
VGRLYRPHHAHQGNTEHAHCSDEYAPVCGYLQHVIYGVKGFFEFTSKQRTSATGVRGAATLWSRPSPQPGKTRFQQQSQGLPRIACQPSRTTSGIMSRAAAGSAHLICQIALTANPTKAISER